MLNMTPIFSGKDVTDPVLGNTKTFADFLLCEPGPCQGADFQYLRLRQFCLALLRPTADNFGMLLSANSSFRCRIPVIVRIRADKEMIRPDTTAVIAVVKDKESVRDGADHQFIRDAMGAGQSIPTAVIIEDAIAASTYSSFPHPARTEVSHMRGNGSVLVDVRPETVSPWSRSFPVVFEESQG